MSDATELNVLFCVGGIVLAVGCALVLDAARGRRRRHAIPVDLADHQKSSS
ncbi:MAG: hypothetical protein OJF50_006474 [Nitrospira sp.]|nr:hypothetical protein [Nitrospira sp.]